MDDVDESTKGIPSMNLMNFEDPEFEDSKYVLTSPRSLEACSRLGVKPVDLLYKPLAEFQEELLPQDVPLRTIYNIYDEYEQNRERKLALAREERQRIMSNRPQSAPVKRKPVAVKAKKSLTPRAKIPTRKPKLAQKSKLHQSDPELDKGSMQRKRTAWATSVGHKRITNDDINNRVKELHEESMKMRSELLSRKEARVGKKKRPSSGPSISKSYSASDLSLAGTSMLNKTHIEQARPISSRKLKKALGRTSAPVTPKDEKILELMMSKHETENFEHRDRYLRALSWERQKKEEEAARLAAELQRRRLLAEENRIKDQKKYEMQRRRKVSEDEFLKEKERVLNHGKKKWATRYSMQRTLSELKLAEKMEKEFLKKKIQEENVKMLERNEEEVKDLVREKHDRQIHTAAQRKEVKLLDESMAKMLQNRDERRAFEDRWNCVLKDTQDSMDALVDSLKSKESQQKTKYEQILQRREHQLTLSKLDREKRALQAKLVQQQQETEMEEWRDSVMASREVAEKQATETMAQAIERKARKAHEDRLRKERDQKKNIRKIHNEVEQWKKETKSSIVSKDLKSSTVLKEKEDTIAQSRQIALTSEALRSKLRDRYGGESFNQKAFKAELYNKFETGNTFLSSQKNSSNVKLH